MRTLLLFAFISIQCMSIVNGDSDDIEITTEQFEEVGNAMNFKEKAVLVTGSSSGIGAATARTFCYLGADVVVTGRNQSRIDEIVKDCKKLSPSRHSKTFGIQLDLSNRENCAKLVNKTIEKFGKIDILVNAAGIGLVAPIQHPSFNDFYEQVKKINEEASVEMTRLAAAHLQNSKGKVVFIASILGWNPTGATGSYSMGKGAVTSLAQSLAFDLGTDVRVNVLSPGIVDGTRIFRLMTPGIRQLLIANAEKSSSLKRAGTPLHMAKLIVFLCSNLAESLNGQNLHGDQGSYIPVL